MKFHLNYTPPKFDFEINHKDNLFLIGSCFSENIGNLLQEHKFKTYSNPNGILFNPKSIFNCLADIINLKSINENFIFERDGLFYSYLHHSSINGPSKKTFSEQISAITKEAGSFLQAGNYLIITFGTAYIYHHLQLNATVANCHKQASSGFEKRLLTVNEIVSDYTGLLNTIKKFNPQLKIIFTVSPVKHLKDGVIENNLSKSTLVLSIHELIKQNKNCYYFPAYELINDDLRDYRFYEEDMAHPNDLAINYVWEKFSESFFNPKTISINKQLLKLNLALNHRPMHSSNEEQQKLQDFITKQKDVIKKEEPAIEF